MHTFEKLSAKKRFSERKEQRILHMNFELLDENI